MCIPQHLTDLNCSYFYESKRSFWLLSIKKAFKSTCLKRGLAFKMATQNLQKTPKFCSYLNNNNSSLYFDKTEQYFKKIFQQYYGSD